MKKGDKVLHPTQAVSLLLSPFRISKNEPGIEHRGHPPIILYTVYKNKSYYNLR